MTDVLQAVTVAFTAMPPKRSDPKLPDDYKPGARRQIAFVPQEVTKRDLHLVAIDANIPIGRLIEATMMLCLENPPLLNWALQRAAALDHAYRSSPPS